MAPAIKMLTFIRVELVMTETHRGLWIQEQLLLEMQKDVSSQPFSPFSVTKPVFAYGHLRNLFKALGGRCCELMQNYTHS